MFRVFHLFFDFVIFLNIIFVVFNDRGDIEWAFLIIFVIEISLKVYAWGFKEFAADKWNL